MSEGALPIDFNEFIDVLKEAVKIFIVLEIVKASLRQDHYYYPELREDIKRIVEEEIRRAKERGEL